MSDRETETELFWVSWVDQPVRFFKDLVRGTSEKNPYDIYRKISKVAIADIHIGDKISDLVFLLFLIFSAGLDYS